MIGQKLDGAVRKIIRKDGALNNLTEMPAMPCAKPDSCGNSAAKRVQDFSARARGTCTQQQTFLQ